MLPSLGRASALALFAVFALGCGTWAQSSDHNNEDTIVNSTTRTLETTIKFTLGPVLSGADPGGGDGKSGKVTILASESLSPTNHARSSATYTLPAGAITVNAEGRTFTTTHPSKMTIKLGSMADILTLIFTTNVRGAVVTLTSTTFLESGSWTAAVLKHPEVFKRSPQKLTAAESATEPGSKVQYVYDGKTVLGLSGSASNADTEDPVLPDDLDQ
jgi:hypothetical protein